MLKEHLPSPPLLEAQLIKLQQQVLVELKRLVQAIKLVIMLKVHSIDSSFIR